MKKHYWWYEAFGRLPADEDEKYPHPGEVVRSYRQRKGWSHRKLAEELELTSGKMIHYLETECSGLDSIARRRRLVILLEIPPILLGLDSLHLGAEQLWWKEYPLNAATDGCGYPVAGSVIKSLSE